MLRICDHLYFYFWYFYPSLSYYSDNVTLRGVVLTSYIQQFSPSLRSQMLAQGRTYSESHFLLRLMAACDCWTVRVATKGRCFESVSGVAWARWLTLFSHDCGRLIHITSRTLRCAVLKAASEAYRYFVVDCGVLILDVTLRKQTQICICICIYV